MKKIIKLVIIGITFCIVSALKNIDDDITVNSAIIKTEDSSKKIAVGPENKKNTNAQSIAKQETALPLNAEKEFIERVQDIKSISADFTQTENTQSSTDKASEGVRATKNIKKVIKGKLKLAKPNKFLWEISSPVKERQVYSTDGTKYWHYDLGLEQVVVDDFKTDKIASSPLSILLDNSENIAKNYLIKKSNKSNLNIESYQLLAKTNTKIAVNSDYIKNIEIIFIKLDDLSTGKNKRAKFSKSGANKNSNKELSKFVINQINFTIGNVKNVTIELNDVLVNRQINNSVFTFKPPKGVDVINSNELM